MGAYEELRSTGRLGPEGARLLYKAVRVVAEARNFPPPEGHANWDRTATEDSAHEFLDGERGRRRLADLVLRAADEESFVRLLHGAVLNFHRDRSRRTDMGALIRRVSDVLKRSDFFVESQEDPSRWCLSEGPQEPSTVPPPRLAAATSAEDVTVPRWESTRRRAPLADFSTFERLCRRVLEAAHGSLSVSDVAHAIAQRLDPRRVPLTLELDFFERQAGYGAEGETAILGRLQAADIFERLSDRERILLATMDRPVRDLQEVLGLSHSQASVLRRRLTARLAMDLEGDEDPDTVVSELRSLAISWMLDRTTGASPTFSQE